MKVIIVGGVASGASCAARLQKKNVRFISSCKELNAFFGTPLYL